eukprot:TRINITY_DN28932_c0_g1_i1.p2 TRINITY_DN28932_c0_g1~~TRINITY_DN28932_c0_g1_i1.p2  ORF type:complete len:706 (+),score=239.35 TRINITY_DN28932_c0_g1_i1:108-2225(+)
MASSFASWTAGGMSAPVAPGLAGLLSRRKRGALSLTLAAAVVLLAARLVLKEAVGALAWVPLATQQSFGSSSGAEAACVGRRGSLCLRAKADDVEEVLVMPQAVEDDFVDEPLKPQPQPEVAKKKPSVIAKRRGKKEIGKNIDAQQSNKFGAAVGEEGKEKSFDMAASAKAAAELDAAADSLSITKSGKSKSSRRWLLGRGGAKRRKLQENTDLEDWLQTKGVWLSEQADWGKEPHGVSMAIETREQIENEVSGRGLVARRDLEMYEDIARVPLAITMTMNSSRAVFGEDIITEDLSPYTSIALHLIHEAYVLKDKSEWAPYIAVLPTTEEIGASFSWEVDEIETLLEGSQLKNMSLYVRQKVVDIYDGLEESIFKEHPEKFPLEAFTMKNFLWAHSVLFSRAVRLNFDDTPDFVALVPYIDLINHNPSSKTYITGGLEGVDIPGIRVKDRFVYVKADRYFQRYEQIYLSYGPKSNAQLLMLYGFALERNPADFVEVTLSQVLENSSMAELKEEFFETKEMETSNFPLYRDRFTLEMMQFLRVCAVDRSDFKFKKDVNVTDEMLFKRIQQLDLKAPGAGLGEHVERRVVDLLLIIVNELLDSYATTAEEDEQIIKDRAMFEMLPKNTRMATRVKYGEKLILEGTQATLERMLANIKRITEIEYETAKKKRQSAQTFWGRLGVQMEDPGFRPIRNIDDLMAEMGVE